MMTWFIDRESPDPHGVLPVFVRKCTWNSAFAHGAISHKGVAISMPQIALKAMKRWVKRCGLPAVLTILPLRHKPTDKVLIY